MWKKWQKVQNGNKWWWKIGSVPRCCLWRSLVVWDRLRYCQKWSPRVTNGFSLLVSTKIFMGLWKNVTCMYVIIKWKGKCVCPLQTCDSIHHQPEIIFSEIKLFHICWGTGTLIVEIQYLKIQNAWKIQTHNMDQNIKFCPKMCSFVLTMEKYKLWSNLITDQWTLVRYDPKRERSRKGREVSEMSK